MGPVESRSGFAKAVGYQTPRIQDTDLLGVCSKNSLPSLSLTDTGVHQMTREAVQAMPMRQSSALFFNSPSKIVTRNS
jgi:hypothetical protein